MLFGRKQSFAYQKEVEGNPSQRHHVRFWHTPAGWVLPGGRSVDWLAGATYDRSVGLSALTFQVTHKIDADIDIERNFVVDDVRWANAEADLGGVAGLLHRLPRQERRRGPGGDRRRPLRAGPGRRRSGVGGLRGAGPGASGGAQANRQRPPQLLVALILIMLLVGVQSAQLIRDPDVGSAAADLAGEGVAGATGLVYGVVSFFSAAMIATVAALGLAAWHGHPRGRIALLATLTLAVLTDMSQVSRRRGAGRHGLPHRDVGAGGSGSPGADRAAGPALGALAQGRAAGAGDSAIGELGPEAIASSAPHNAPQPGVRRVSLGAPWTRGAGGSGCSGVPIRRGARLMSYV